LIWEHFLPEPNTEENLKRDSRQSLKKWLKVMEKSYFLLTSFILSFELEIWNDKLMLEIS
jgi:hypothetical protein